MSRRGICEREISRKPLAFLRRTRRAILGRGRLRCELDRENSQFECERLVATSIPSVSPRCVLGCPMVGDLKEELPREAFEAKHRAIALSSDILRGRTRKGCNRDRKLFLGWLGLS